MEEERGKRKIEIEKMAGSTHRMSHTDEHGGISITSRAGATRGIDLAGEAAPNTYFFLREKSVQYLLTASHRP